MNVLEGLEVTHKILKKAEVQGVTSVGLGPTGTDHFLFCITPLEGQTPERIRLIQCGSRTRLLARGRGCILTDELSGLFPVQTEDAQKWALGRLKQPMSTLETAQCKWGDGGA